MFLGHGPFWVEVIYGQSNYRVTWSKGSRRHCKDKKLMLILSGPAWIKESSKAKIHAFCEALQIF